MRAGVPVNMHTALQVDSVFTAVRVITNAIIKMGNPRAYTEATGPGNMVYRNYLAQQPSILTNTFGNMFQFDGQTRTVMSLALFGEAFWYVLTRDYAQRPSALEVLNPAFVEIKQNKVTLETEYWYGTGTQKRKLDNEDVVHIPFLAMPGAQRGLNSVEYAGVAYALALAAMEYGQRWFSQGASPSYLLTTDAKLGQDEVKRIAQKFLIEHSGLQAAHLPLVLDSGLKAQKIQSTPDEAQYINTLEYARMCIASWFGIPSHLVGGLADKGNVWGKTVEEQSLQMVDYTLSGYIVRLDEAYSSLLPRGTKAALNDSAIIRANAQERAAELLAIRTAGVKTKNEIRVGDLQMPPVEGGDQLTDPLNSNASDALGTVFASEAADETGTPVDSSSSQEAA
jgi:HK97 family phage portal protein